MISHPPPTHRPIKTRALSNMRARLAFECDGLFPVRRRRRLVPPFTAPPLCLLIKSFLFNHLLFFQGVFFVCLDSLMHLWTPPSPPLVRLSVVFFRFGRGGLFAPAISLTPVTSDTPPPPPSLGGWVSHELRLTFQLHFDPWPCCCRPFSGRTSARRSDFASSLVGVPPSHRRPARPSPHSRLCQSHTRIIRPVSRAHTLRSMARGERKR